MITIAVVAVLIAYVATGWRDTCPKHSDCFDLMVCPLCSIKMFRQQEIDSYCARFEQGRNGSLPYD